MPTIRNTRLVYSTDPDTEVEPRKPARDRSRRKRSRTRPPLPNDGVVRIFLERKGRGGKTVSVLRGVAGDESAKKALLKRLKAELGTGGALKDGDLELQGDHRERLLQILPKLGYTARKAGG
ncbi:MAG: stress response translation initiation inhibitor YciH [Caldilineae bacterium]|nr:MAG: stress response translation initiation inhibitor YciH [Caldilineae bacterium]